MNYRFAQFLSLNTRFCAASSVRVTYRSITFQEDCWLYASKTKEKIMPLKHYTLSQRGRWGEDAGIGEA